MQLGLFESGGAASAAVYPNHPGHAATDTSIIPTRFEPVIVSRAKYYTYMFRSDTQTAQFALKEYEDSLKRMRVELLNRKDYMRAV